MTIQWLASYGATIKVGNTKEVIMNAHDVGNEIQLEEVAETDFPGPEVEDRGHNSQTDVGSNDSVPLMGLEERRRRLEMLYSHSIRSRQMRGCLIELTLVPGGYIGEPRALVAR
jgi:hypothetical protein